MKRNKDNETSQLELCDIIVMITIVQVTVCIVSIALGYYQQLLNDLDETIRRTDYNYQSRNKRKKLSEIIDTIKDRQFCKMLRCHKASFIKLVKIIKDRMDPTIFKSDVWLDNNKQHNTAISGELLCIYPIFLIFCFILPLFPSCLYHDLVFIR